MRKLRVRQGGAWVIVNQPYIRDEGVWRPANHVFVRQGGAWVMCYRKFYDFVYNVTTQQAGPLNPYTTAQGLGWDTITPIRMQIFIRSGGFLHAPNTGAYALVFQNALPAGSTIALTLENNGFISGYGGAGGNGDNSATGGTTGASGGPAIFIGSTSPNVTITNYGIISGGGGGGGGGLSQPSTGLAFGNNHVAISGGGGGGGAPFGAGGSAGINNSGAIAYYAGTGGGAASQQYAGAGGATQHIWFHDTGTVWYSVYPGFYEQGGFVFSGAPGVPYAHGGNGGGIGNWGSTPQAQVYHYWGNPFWQQYYANVPDQFVSRAGGPPGNSIDGMNRVNWVHYGDVRGGSSNT